MATPNLSYANAAAVDAALLSASPPVQSTTVTTSDVTAEANKHYQLTISGLTADRHLILPSGASAGDVISWELMTDAPADYELILKGDTGVTVTLRNESFTAAEVTRYFIEGETGKAVYDGSEWRINKSNDGRIACVGSMYLSTSATGEPAGTFVAPTSYSGVWTALKNIGALNKLTSSSFLVRRSGSYKISGCGENVTGYTGSFIVSSFIGSSEITWARSYATSGIISAAFSNDISFSTGEEVVFKYYTAGSKGLIGGTGHRTMFSVCEVI